MPANHQRCEVEVVDTSHIRNVHYLATHNLTRHNCGWYGWEPKGRTEKG